MKPRVAVIIPTLNRPQDLGRCIESVLACEYDDFEVIVVDQSASSRQLPKLQYKGLRYIHATLPGKCLALNRALRTTSAEIVLFTDDDCVVNPSWISRHVEVLSSEPQADLVFGALVAGPHDPAKTMIPAFGPVAFTQLKGSWAFLQRGGSGGNLAVRKSLFAEIGFFDTRFGPGARFRSCEEFDLYCRALWDGFPAAFDPQNPVTHLGARDYADGSAQRLMKGYAFGEGAVLGKHLEKGNLRAGAAIVLLSTRYGIH